MTYTNPDHFCVAIGDDVIVLDVAADTYSCVIDGAKGGDPSRHARVDIPALPAATLIHRADAVRFDVRRALDALLSLRDVEAAKRAGGLAPFLALAAPLTVDRRPTQALQDEALWFWRFSGWLPEDGQCLERSALLIAYLRRRGLAADWLFGVRLWPFAAHCWVQAGSICLNDDPERLIAFTTILRV